MAHYEWYTVPWPVLSESSYEVYQAPGYSTCQNKVIWAVDFAIVYLLVFAENENIPKTLLLQIYSSQAEICEEKLGNADTQLFVQLSTSAN